MTNPTRREPRDRSHAFTIIELLVVIAIIALLIGILFPVLSSVRSKAQTAVCLSNTRQIVTAVIADAGDNSGRLTENRTKLDPTSPLAVDPNRAEHITWRARFANDGLTSDPGVWECPAHPGEGPIGEEGTWDNTTFCVGDVPSSYALNGHVIWRPDVNGERAVVSDTSILRPSHTILLAEARAQFPDIRITDNLVAAEFDDGGFYGFWHQGDGNYAFQDGHAETINFMDTGSPDCRWHNGLDLSEDRFDKQEQGETTQHAHPDWEYLLNPVYLD